MRTRTAGALLQLRRRLESDLDAEGRPLGAVLAPLLAMGSAARRRSVALASLVAGLTIVIGVGTWMLLRTPDEKPPLAPTTAEVPASRPPARTASYVASAPVSSAPPSITPDHRAPGARIETEIAFLMNAPLSGRVTREDVLVATEAVAPAIEILDTRVRRADPETGQPRIITDTVADNAANGGIVLGAERHDPRAVDLRWAGAIVSRNGEVEETGLGAGVLNDPVEGVVWLARRLAEHGQRIEAGQVILSGSFIRPVECPPGAMIEADFGPFGSVSCSFA